MEGLNDIDKASGWITKRYRDIQEIMTIVVSWFYLTHHCINLYVLGILVYVDMMLDYHRKPIH